MATSEESSDGQDRARYLVECEDCGLERAADGRAEAKQIANNHHRGTGHELVVVEWPRSTTPP